MKAEGDVVASTKEAEQAGQQVIKEMSGFKFAVSFLFNSATEAMATATRRAR